MHPAVEEEQIMSIYSDYIKFIYPELKFSRKALFSPFHLNDMKEILANYILYLPAITVLVTYAPLLEFINSDNKYCFLLGVKKIIEFAKQLEIKPIKVKAWTKIVLAFCFEKKYVADKFIKYACFNDFSLFFEKHELREAYYSSITT